MPHCKYTNKTLKKIVLDFLELLQKQEAKWDKTDNLRQNTTFSEHKFTSVLKILHNGWRWWRWHLEGLHRTSLDHLFVQHSVQPWVKWMEAFISSHFPLYRDLPLYEVHQIGRAAAYKPTLLECGRFGELVNALNCIILHCFALHCTGQD